MPTPDVDEFDHAALDASYRNGPDVIDELSKFERDDDETTTRRPWRIGDPGHNGEPFDAELAGTWLLRKLAAAVTEVERLTAVADAERDRLMADVQPQLDALDDWLDDRLAGIGRHQTWAEGRLAEWQHRLRVDGTASLSLPSGDLKSRKAPGRLLMVSDVQALADELQQLGHGDLVEYVPKVNLPQLKKLVQVDTDGHTVRIDGEQVTQLTWAEGAITYTQHPATPEPPAV